MAATPFPYEATPPTTDPVKQLREARIANRYLRSELSRQDTELAARDRLVAELTQELVSFTSR